MYHPALPPIRSGTTPDRYGIDIRTLPISIAPYGWITVSGLTPSSVSLEVACGWEATSEVPVGTSTLEHFTDAAISQIPGVTRDECSHAIEWLTLRTTDLTASPREYWKTDLRVTRVDTRPFVSYDSSLYVLPWTAATTLAILSNYLGDGRLPWPQETLRKNVVQALNRYRQGKNDQLEKDCYEELADTPLVIRRNIEPAGAHR